MCVIRDKPQHRSGWTGSLVSEVVSDVFGSVEEEELGHADRLDMVGSSQSVH